MHLGALSPSCFDSFLKPIKAKMEVYNAMVVPMTYESWMLIENKKARLQATDKRIEKDSRSDQAKIV